MTDNEAPQSEVAVTPTNQQEFLDSGITPVYSDVARIHFSAEDVQLIFGLRETFAPGTAKVQARVFLSHAHAKRLAGALVRQIRAVERDLGTIDEDPARKIVVKQKGEGDD